MANIGLTSQEKVELKKRGFFVKNNAGLVTLIWSILYTSILFYTYIGIDLLWNALFYVYTFDSSVAIFGIVCMIAIGFTFALSQKIFYGKDGVIGYGKYQADDKRIQLFDLFWKKVSQIIGYCLAAYGRGIDEMISLAAKTRGYGRVGILALLIMLMPLLLLIYACGVWGEYLFTQIALFSNFEWYWNILFGLASIFITVPITYIISGSIKNIYPLYAFGNLGEKIQKLTPQIATQSNQIEMNFASDMNYRVLSDGFDGLASTFSQIVSLVIRLERVEARANKGNLFDSTKYISSLRSDIVGPLRSLRDFLIGKRTELISAQQELSRVRVQVGGTSEQRDLASVRTEPLMGGLTENITQLDVMIEKMG